MKFYKDLYWSIISPKTLFRAWEIFKSDKRKKPDVALFERDIEKNIFDLYNELKRFVLILITDNMTSSDF